MARRPWWNDHKDTVLGTQLFPVSAWEGSVSETKAEYYAKHLQRLQEQVITDEQVERIEPTGLPTLLAQLVIEYEHTLLPGERLTTTHSDALVEDFNRTLLAAAQPLLTEYLSNLANPPYVIKVRE